MEMKMEYMKFGTFQQYFGIHCCPTPVTDATQDFVKGTPEIFTPRVKYRVARLNLPSISKGVILVSVADLGFPRVRQLPRGCANLLFSKFFAKHRFLRATTEFCQISIKVLQQFFGYLILAGNCWLTRVHSYKFAQVNEDSVFAFTVLEFQFNGVHVVY